MAWLATAGLAVVPLIFVDMADRFRVIKDLAMRTEALVALLLLTIALAWGGMERLREMARERIVVYLAAGIAVWAVVTTLTSTHRLVSEQSLITVACLLVIFVAVWYAAPRVGFEAVDALALTATVNTVILMLQELRIWQPFAAGAYEKTHLASTALLGNPNIVGSWLALVTIVLVTALPHLAGARRWTTAAAAAIAFIGVIFSQTRTALLVLAAVAVVAAAMRSWKRAAIIAAAVPVLFVAAIVLHVPGMERFAKMPRYWKERRWVSLSSERLPPFLVALEMFRDHPLVGAGPGTFKIEYMPYKVRLANKYPQNVLRVGSEQFGETHDDHLQLLAEGGLPAYALFLGALAVIAWRRRPHDEERDDGEDEDAASDVRRRFAITLGWRIAVALFVLALAQFPLQIALTEHFLVTFAALVIGWRSM